jgi:leader peptidase (prepilin peptidase) / N-methyltransferase
MIEPAQAALLAVTGAAVGSFLNVLAHRLPLGLSIVSPRSACPACAVPIAPYDNIPIVSWVWLRGRCRSCGSGISARYPIIEAMTAALFAAVALRADSPSELWPGLAFVAMLVAVAAIDLEHRIVPNRILAPAALAALALWAVTDPNRVPQNLLAGLIAGTFLLVFAVIYSAGMGMGDVKLAAVMGLYLGRSVAPALFIGFAAGAVVGVGMMVARGASARKRAIPFAPFLAAGGVLGQLFGDEIVDWYLDISG